MSWTDERVETLKRMWAEGQSASQIAKELGGVTRNAVIGKVHRLGLSNRAEDEAAPAEAVAPSDTRTIADDARDVTPPGPRVEVDEADAPKSADTPSAAGAAASPSHSNPCRTHRNGTSTSAPGRSLASARPGERRTG